jgi:hypothetical protein
MGASFGRWDDCGADFCAPADPNCQCARASHQQTPRLLCYCVQYLKVTITVPAPPAKAFMSLA